MPDGGEGIQWGKNQRILMNRLFRIRLALLACGLLFQVPAFAQWYPFDWAEMPGFSNRRGAISLPVELDGIECHMQLDTASPNSILYRDALPAKLSPEPGSERLAIAQFRIGAERSARSFDLIYAPRPGGQPTGCGDVVGTIGSDYLVGASLTLDLPGARFQIRRGPAPEPKGGVAGAHVLAMELLEVPRIGVSPAINATLANGEAVKLLFDTGSAPIEIQVFVEDNWLKLVGVQTLADVKPNAVPRWGAWMSCYNAPTREAVSYGGLVLKPGAIATLCVDPRDVPKPSWLYGVIGLAAFANDRITLDYAAGKLIVEPSGPPHQGSDQPDAVARGRGTGKL
jgi:hypothetical protein